MQALHGNKHQGRRSLNTGRKETMQDLRIIEIAEGCMGGESCIYYTNASDEAIEQAIKTYREDDDQSGLEALEKDYIFHILVDTLETCFYSEIRAKINIDKQFSIY